MTHFDMDGDGYSEAIGFDTDGDGVVDELHVDTNLDGFVDAVVFDPNQDGVADLIQVDTDGDGYRETLGFDTDADGVADRFMTDLDRDGIAESTLHPGNQPPYPAVDAPGPSADDVTREMVTNQQLSQLTSFTEANTERIADSTREIFHQEDFDNDFEIGGR